LLNEIVAADDFPRITDANRHTKISQSRLLEPGRKALQRPNRKHGLASPLHLCTREVTDVRAVVFNPNLKSSWFTAVMQVINNLTLLTVILTGAALIREREQGTVEHLVMPVIPAEIMLSKALANGLVILIAAGLSLNLVVQWWLQVPIAGSLLLLAVHAFMSSQLRRSVSCSARSPLRWASLDCWRFPCY
jgi:hypothetical protein